MSEKNKKKTKQIIRNQIQKAITNKKFLKKILFAYEPVWSIGTGKVPKLKELQKTAFLLKKFLKSRFGGKYNFKLLYGGSVDNKSIRNFKLIKELDGFLIGGASKSSKKFIDIIRNFYK